MSFGLTNAPVAFMDLMRRVSQPYLDQFVVVYVDDNLIYSKTKEEHKDHLRICWLTKVKFLGVSMDPEKVEAVMSWERLKSVFEIHSFLGLARYYRRFIKDFS